MKKDTIIMLIDSEGEAFKIPILPEAYSDERSNRIQTFETLESGEIAIKGGEKLKKLSFSSFFSDINYPFNKKEMSKDGYVKRLTEIMKSSEPVRVIITGTDINFKYIISSLQYEAKDGTDDIYYRITFDEYKETNVDVSKNTAPIHPVTGLKERPKNYAGKKSAKPKKLSKKNVVKSFLSNFAETATKLKKQVAKSMMARFVEGATVIKDFVGKHFTGNKRTYGHRTDRGLDTGAKLFKQATNNNVYEKYAKALGIKHENFFK